MSRTRWRQVIRSVAGVWLGVLAMATQVCADGGLVTGTDEDAKLPFWEWQSEAMSIRLVQRLPDQSRAYFMARGFDKTHAERIATSCVFQTVYKNTATAGTAHVIEFNLNQWKVQFAGQSRSLKLREHWQQEWEKEKVAQGAQIAFQWSLLPTQQRYQPQDYNWGMTVFDLPPATKFDLLIVWKHNGREQSATIPQIECAPDVHPDPTEFPG